MKKFIAFFARIQVRIEFFLNLCYLIFRQNLHELYKIICRNFKKRGEI